jgi:hypothetical protein
VERRASFQLWRFPRFATGNEVVEVFPLQWIHLLSEIFIRADVTDPPALTPTGCNKTQRRFSEVRTEWFFRVSREKILAADDGRQSVFAPKQD